MTANRKTSPKKYAYLIVAADIVVDDTKLAMSRKLPGNVVDGIHVLAEELLDEVTLLSIWVVSSPKLNIVIQPVGITEGSGISRSGTACQRASRVRLGHS